MFKLDYFSQKTIPSHKIRRTVVVKALVLTFDIDRKHKRLNACLVYDSFRVRPLRNEILFAFEISSICEIITKSKMSTSVDQKAYLQKYLSGHSKDKKKKKKKEKRAIKGKGCVFHN